MKPAKHWNGVVSQLKVTLTPLLSWHQYTWRTKRHFSECAIQHSAIANRQSADILLQDRYRSRDRAAEGYCSGPAFQVIYNDLAKGCLQIADWRWLSAEWRTPRNVSWSAKYIDASTAVGGVFALPLTLPETASVDTVTSSVIHCYCIE